MVGCGSSSSNTSSSSPAGTAATTASASTSNAKITPPPSIKKAGKITYCADISFPPFESYTANNQPQGADVDIGNALAKMMGVKAVWRNTSFDGIIPALQANQCDAIISGLYDKASRRKVVDFVDYAKLGNSIAVQRGNPKHVNGLASLSGLKVGVESGTTLRLQLLAENKKLAAAGKKPMDILDFPTDADAFEQLVAGNVDAYYTVASTVVYYQKKTNGQIELAPGPQVSAFPFGIATRKNDKPLHVAFVKGLAALRKSGQYMTILKHWNLTSSAIAP